MDISTVSSLQILWKILLWKCLDKSFWEHVLISPRVMPSRRVLGLISYTSLWKTPVTFQKATVPLYLPTRNRRLPAPAHSYQLLVVSVFFIFAILQGLGGHPAVGMIRISLMAPLRGPKHTLLPAAAASPTSSWSERAKLLLTPGPWSQLSSHNLESAPHNWLIPIPLQVSAWIHLRQDAFQAPFLASVNRELFIVILWLPPHLPCSALKTRVRGGVLTSCIPGCEHSEPL